MSRRLLAVTSDGRDCASQQTSPRTLCHSPLPHYSGLETTLHLHAISSRCELGNNETCMQSRIVALVAPKDRPPWMENVENVDFKSQSNLHVLRCSARLAVALQIKIDDGKNEVMETLCLICGLYRYAYILLCDGPRSLSSFHTSFLSRSARI